jgi:NAD(P)-dependent dehydrogenase (short-subunit alcohol dehydrogenase family)
MRRRSALVTGARRGIGRATAFALAEAGFDLLISDAHDGPETEETLAGIRERGARGDFVRQDIADLDEHVAVVERCYATFGGLDCLVNNAGIQIQKRVDLLEAGPEEFDKLIRVNLRGTFFLTQAVARRMVAESQDSCSRTIITITSANAVMVSPEKSFYCLSKSALSMAVQLFAVRLAEHNIACFEIRPGLIRTGMTAPVRDSYGARIERGLSPVRRWGEASEVAKAAASLATGALPFSTGHAINIDGGLLIFRL